MGERIGVTDEEWAIIKSQNALLCDFVMYARTLLEEKWTDSTEEIAKPISDAISSSACSIS